MAIEYNTDTEPQESVSPGADSDSETVDIPMTMIGGKTVSPGDVIRLEVVSSNDDSGTITAKYAEPKTEGGIQSMAAKFEE